MNETNEGRDDVKMVVSDAMAKNSRQLLNAHIYNYLVENKRYDTAKQFLLEADVPVFEERNRNDEGRVRMKRQKEVDADLLPAKMLMDCKDTFLYEWWESFDSLQSFVDNTPSEAFQGRNAQREPIVPLAPSNMSSYNMMGTGTPQARTPMPRNSGFMPQANHVPNNASPESVAGNQFSSYNISEDGTPNTYQQDNGVFPRQR